MREKMLRRLIPGLMAALLLSALPGAEAQTRRQTQRRAQTTSLIPQGTELRVRLNDNLSSDDSRVGDRFTVTVMSPQRYEGARLNGHISSIKKSGRVSGNTTMTLAFDTVEMPGGRTGRIRGQVVNLLGEDSQDVDEEGSVQSGGRGKQTLKRSGIGAAAGAVVGGLIGGGKGAAIGILVGGAGGAGSLAIKGSKELKLEEGQQMLVRVTR